MLSPCTEEQRVILKIGFCGIPQLKRSCFNAQGLFILFIYFILFFHLFPGLTLEINIEQHEYVSHLSQEAGIRVFVGVQKEMPFPYEQGISVSPGFSTAMQLRKVTLPVYTISLFRMYSFKLDT